MSAEWTVGIEEEYQIVDPQTGRLEGRAPEVLARTRVGEAEAEFQRTMIEVCTPVSTDVDSAVRKLAERRRWVGRAARENGLALAAAGLHPEGAFPASQLTPDQHYWRVAASGGVVARQLHIFGMHIHVAVPDREAAIRVMRAATAYIPHLLALSGSSPLHRGLDTEFQSFRTLIRDMFSRVGPPLPVSSANEYDQLLHTLARAEGEERGTISWDIRPSERYPTVEFRFFDVVPSLDAVAGIASCVRALTVLCADVRPRAATGLELQLLIENRWRAARHGLEAEFYPLDPVDPERVRAPDAIRALLDRVEPTAARLGDGATLQRVETLLEAGTAADRMRAVYRQTGSLAEVTRWVARETMEVGEWMDQEE